MLGDRSSVGAGGSRPATATVQGPSTRPGTAATWEGGGWPVLGVGAAAAAVGGAGAVAAGGAGAGLVGLRGAGAAGRQQPGGGVG